MLDELDRALFYVGWDELLQGIPLKEAFIRRALAYYRFPKPMRTREKGYTVNVWNKEEIATWMVRQREKGRIK